MSTTHRVVFTSRADGKTQIVCTPGVIRNNRPKAIRVLKWLRADGTEAILQKLTVDGRWEKEEA